MGYDRRHTLAGTEASKTWALIRELRTTRAATVARFGLLEPARLSELHDWRGARSDLRFQLSWLSEGTENRRIQILGVGRLLARPRMTDAQHALGIAAALRGRLLGHLIGLPDPLFDQAPAPGEWSVRQVLGHVIAVDERYRIGVEHAVARARRGGEGPLRPDDAALPPRTGETMSAGAPAVLLERAQSVHDVLMRNLGAIPDELLAAPTNWAAVDVDVRFRLHRFAAHDREHTIQIRKTLESVGFHPTEPQLLLADAQAELGALEATLGAIGDGFLDQRPPSGGSTIRDLVEESLADERSI
jgi:hypothetical protein